MHYEIRVKGVLDAHWSAWWPCPRSTVTHQLRGSDLDAHRLKGIRLNDQAPATGPLAAAVPTI
jgi:hypothetical protein